MPIIRTFAVQGHEIPSIVHSPRGPFPPEVLAQPRMTHEDSHADSLHSALDDVRFFRCKTCNEILPQEDLDAHECSE